MSFKPVFLNVSLLLKFCQVLLTHPVFNGILHL